MNNLKNDTPTLTAQCGNCNNKITEKYFFKQCSKCKLLIKYCKRKCETEHWTEHIKLCSI